MTATDNPALDAIAEQLGEVSVSDGQLEHRDHDDGEPFGYDPDRK